MRPDHFADLAIFAAVAFDRSVTRAAKRLGVTQSALSRTMMSLWCHLGLRQRTTWRVP